MAQILQDVHKLDELLSVVEHCSPADEAECADEHIHSMRTCLLGAMPAESRLNLELARKTLARLDDNEARRKAQKIFASLSKPG
jgi:hypothetical protein